MKAKHRAIESTLALNIVLTSQASPCLLFHVGRALCEDSAHPNNLFGPWTLNPYL